jgi:hypothetical protein
LKSSVSVIIVSYNTKDKLRQCLSCIEPEFEVIVVDNDSKDGSPEMVRNEFPGVNLIENPANLGFGAANNIGCKAAHSDLVLFLNSDAYAAAGAISTLARVFNDSTVVAAGGKLLNLDRSLQQSTAEQLTLWRVFCEQTYLEKIFRGSNLFDSYWTTLRHSLIASPSETPQVMGACLMVRAKDGTPVETFDVRYFLYCEDTDLCRRLEQHGKILYVPDAEFVHELGSSSAKDPALGVIRYNRGKELYFRIHHGAFASALCLLFDRFGALLRFLAWSAKYAITGFRNQNSKKQAGAFWRVLTAKYRSPKE